MVAFQDSSVGDVAWSNFITWANDQAWMHRDFFHATGILKPPPPAHPNSIDVMIDKACDLSKLLEDYAESFVIWATVWHYGWTLSPYPIRELIRTKIEADDKIGKWSVKKAAGVHASHEKEIEDEETSGRDVD